MFFWFFFFRFSYLKDVPHLRLIDFGCSIDMKLFPSNTAFKKRRNTSAFVCTQMKLNLPWNYHVGLYFKLLICLVETEKLC